MKVFVGGATGATGQVFLPEARALGLEVVAHARPRSANKLVAGATPAIFELADSAALDAAMQGCDAVVCLIGTMMKRFGAGDTYAASDIGGTRALVEAAQRVGVKHFVLMGSLGTDWTPGPYMNAKREAERIVKTSGLRWAIARPAGLHRDQRDGKLSGLDRSLGALWLDVRMIPVRVVARALAHVVLQGREGVLTGRDLWALGEGS